MIKSDFGKVEIKCNGFAEMMSELTSAIKGVADSLRTKGMSEDKIRKEIDMAVKFAFMSEDDFDLIDEMAEKLNKGLAAALEPLSEALKRYAKDFAHVFDNEKEGDK